ncbi:unnamed protein product [Psylliodes chrysocephalus]|uniref:BED-type domain-containing protein n=1 Tax=Psylliodes chrysocephalus TaxID=3402493 RepID=A0A9P0G6D9_9CUCU|nr:unnamed protein product [Psylliodes chrysocephala]
MPPRRKYSAVWAHFSENENKKLAKCNYCHQPISIASGSVGNLNRHLKSKHPTILVQSERLENLLELNEVQQMNNETVEVKNNPQVQSSSSSQTCVLRVTSNQPTITHFIRKPPPARKTEQIDRQMLKMIAKGHHAFRIVEEPEFRKLIEMVSFCPGYQPPTRKSLSNNLMTTVENSISEDIKEKLISAKAVCITTDGWTSRNNDSFIAVTAHFINSETKLCSCTLGCIQYDERHTADNLCSFLKEMFNKWNICNKIGAVVSDNASNILAAVRVGEWRSIGCFAHLLNLIVRTGTVPINNQLIKVKRIVEYFKRSTQAQKKLSDTQQQMGLPLLKIKQDVVTRWNSTYDMLSRIVKIKEAVIATIALLKSDLILLDSDWIIIEESVNILEIFYGITTEISSEKTVSLSKVIVFIKIMTQNVAQTIKNHQECQQPITEIMEMLYAIQEGILTRFQDYENEPLYSESTILDPRFKKRGFKNVSKFDKAVIGLRKRLGAVPTQASTTSTSVFSSKSNTTTTTQVQKKNIVWDTFDAEIDLLKPQNTTAAAIIELDKYLNEDIVPRSTDPLQWWHQRRPFYPLLYNYMLKRLCIIATSVPCERVFSNAGQILNERRTLLKSERVSNSEGSRPAPSLSLEIQEQFAGIFNSDDDDIDPDCVSNDDDLEDVQESQSAPQKSEKDLAMQYNKQLMKKNQQEMMIQISTDEEKNSLKTEIAVQQADMGYTSKEAGRTSSMSNPQKKTICFDLQQRLPTPDLQSGETFYKRQL